MKNSKKEESREIWYLNMLREIEEASKARELKWGIRKKNSKRTMGLKNWRLGQVCGCSRVVRESKYPITQTKSHVPTSAMFLLSLSTHLLQEHPWVSEFLQWKLLNNQTVLIPRPFQSRNQYFHNDFIYSTQKTNGTKFSHLYCVFHFWNQRKKNVLVEGKRSETGRQII